MALISSLSKDIISPVINDVIPVDFLPSDLLNLHLWLDASDLSTITESGNAISQWDDRRNNGKFANQTTGTRQPTLILDAINGLPAIDFDGANDNLITTFSFDPSTTDFTLFFVAKFDDDSSGRNLLAQQDGVGDGRSILFASAGNLLRSVLGGIGLDGPTISFNPEIYILKFEGTDLDLSISGGTPSSFSSITPESATGDWVIGANKGLAGEYNGFIGEIAIFDRALSDAEDVSMNQYFSNKWGIVLA